jgi:putative Mg2+ transporter-C (MgtC) family protein
MFYMFFPFEFGIYEFNIFSVTLRLFLATVLGGVIGLERGSNKQAAGFRTHILVCVGAALAMLTNEYIFETFGAVSDPSRLGAQVITGVGFLGVGTILIAGRSKIRGLTTAAGLWASACIGLAVGIGFYAGAVIAAVLVLVSLALLPRLEKVIYQRSRSLSIYVEIDSIRSFKPLIKEIKERNISILDAHLDRSSVSSEGGAVVSMIIRLPRKLVAQDVLDEITQLQYVLIVEEI